MESTPSKLESFSAILFLSVLVVGGLGIYFALAVFLGAASKNFMKMLKTN